MELNRKNVLILGGIVAFGVVLHWGLANFSQLAYIFSVIFGLVLPFVVGGGIAFILNTPMRWIESRLFPPGKGGRAAAKLRRPVSLSLTLILMAAVITVIIFLIIPELGRSMDTLRSALPAFAQKVSLWSLQLSERWPEISQWLLDLEVDWKQIVKSMTDFLRNGAGSVISSTISIAFSVFNTFLTVVLGLIFALYLLAQKEQLTAEARNFLYAYFPTHRADRILEIGRLTNRTFSKFLTGQLTEALILGTMFFLAMTVFGFPFALMISVLVGVTALIPVFGAFIGCFVGIFVIVIENPAQALWFLALFLVLQQVEGNLIYPRVVGNSVGLPSIWVLAAVTVGGSAMGVVGMLIFIPLCSVLYTLMKEAVAQRLLRKGMIPGKGLNGLEPQAPPKTQAEDPQ